MESPKKTALILEGGGIRSSYLSGVLKTFHDAGVNKFDLVVGTSAGACCGANFIAGEPEKNIIILRDYLTSKDFVSLARIPTFKNIVDIDFLIDDVCVKKVPLNIPKIQNAKSLLYLVATEYFSGEPAYFNNREHNIFEAMRASCAMPYLYRKQATYLGKRYIDGGMVSSIPIAKAIEEGATELVVIGTRKQGYQKKETAIPKWLFNFCCPDNPRMGEFFKKRHLHYNRELELLRNPPAGIKIHYIAPETELPVTRITTDRAKVVAAIDMGIKDGERFLKKNATKIDIVYASKTR